jgi:hypothetical protein
MLPKPGTTMSPWVVAQLNMPMERAGTGDPSRHWRAAATAISTFEWVVRCELSMA